MSKGLSFDFSGGFFRELGAMVSGRKSYPLDTTTAVYCCLLSCGTWDFDEEVIVVSITQLALKFSKEDADDMCALLVSKKLAEYDQNDNLVIARIENGRQKYLFGTDAKQPERRTKPSSPLARRAGAVKSAPPEDVGVFNDDEFADVLKWIEESYVRWHSYLSSSHKESLAESTYQKMRNAMKKAYEGRMLKAQFMDYFLGCCAMHNEWTNSPAMLPKDIVAADRAIKLGDHRLLLKMVPFWFENSEKVRKGMTGTESVATFMYYYNNIIALMAKGETKTRQVNKTRDYGSKTGSL